MEPERKQALCPTDVLAQSKVGLEGERKAEGILKTNKQKTHESSGQGAVLVSTDRFSSVTSRS